METDEIPRNLTNLPPKPRRLPEIPKDQEPYDVTKAPRKPPRQRPGGHRCSTPDLQRRSSTNSSLHKRSRSLTEARHLSRSPGDEESYPLVRGDGDLRHRNSSVDRQVSLTTNVDQTTSLLSRKESFPLAAYCGEDAIFNRRCATCHQRIFPEGERFLIAQTLLFHVTCFRCAICSTCVDVTDYCYVTEHEKFYCLRHYHGIVEAGKGIGNENKIVDGAGPGAFTAVVGRCRKRKEILKTLTELQSRRTKLTQIAFQLKEAMKSAKSEEEPFLWRHWFDVTYEKIMMARTVTELAYQLKEVELCDEQEQLQRKLRRLRKGKRKGDREGKEKEEEIVLHEILNVIEKRDLLLLELEIERRRDEDETQKLKRIFDDQSRTARLQKTDFDKLSDSHEEIPYTDSQNGQCVIL